MLPDDFDLIALAPMNMPVHMNQAWVGFIRSAVTDPTVIEVYRYQTGIKFRPPKHAFELLIDEATGYYEKWLTQFIPWVTAYMWGVYDSQGRDIVCPLIDKKEARRCLVKLKSHKKSRSTS